MYDTGQVLSEHLAQLSFNFPLYEFLYDSNGIKGAVDIDILEGIGLEDERDTLLPGHNQNDVGVELEMGQSEQHRDHEGLLGSKHTARATKHMDIGLLMVEGIGLHARFNEEKNA